MNVIRIVKGAGQGAPLPGSALLLIRFCMALARRRAQIVATAHPNHNLHDSKLTILDMPGAARGRSRPAWRGPVDAGCAGKRAGI
ncbi:hypothetical protein ACVBGC_25995 [Burkholderia stagnalis]